MAQNQITPVKPPSKAKPTGIDMDTKAVKEPKKLLDILYEVKNVTRALLQFQKVAWMYFHQMCSISDKGDE